MPKALVTGGAGYFGELLVRRLASDGYSVRVLDICPPSGACSGVEYLRADIRDGGRVREACGGIDVVFHNVAQVPLAKDTKLFWSVNRDGTRVLLEASLLGRVKKVVYTSSSAVFGIPKSNPVGETAEPVPCETYGRAKLEGEKLCAEYNAKGLDVSIIRPRTIMGHGRLGIFQTLFEWIYRGKNVPVLNGGTNIYQFVHADDLADACILASRREGFDTFHCGAVRYGTMREVLTAVCNYARTGSRVKSLPSGLIVPLMKAFSAIGLSPLGAYHSLMYGRSMYFDTTKAQTKLGWVPKYSNDEMFLQSYQWYVENRESVLAQREVSSPHRSALKEGILKIVPWFLG